MYHRNISPTNFVTYHWHSRDTCTTKISHKLTWWDIIDYHWLSLIWKYEKLWLTNSPTDSLSDNLKSGDACASRSYGECSPDHLKLFWQNHFSIPPISAELWWDIWKQCQRKYERKVWWQLWNMLFGTLVWKYLHPT